MTAVPASGEDAGRPTSRSGVTAQRLRAQPLPRTRPSALVVVRDFDRSTERLSEEPGPDDLVGLDDPSQLPLELAEIAGVGDDPESVAEDRVDDLRRN